MRAWASENLPGKPYRAILLDLPYYPAPPRKLPQMAWDVLLRESLKRMSFRMQMAEVRNAEIL